MMNVLLKQAISSALYYAGDKDRSGLLIKCDDHDFDDIFNIIDSVETIYSISSMYADDINADEAWDRDILNALLEVYPNHG
ncbi:MAG TPA: hypothetical protein DCW93_04600 [Saprospirales bacterium]|nr:hypothetical protein [Saprospirales bacterium]